MLLSPMVNTVSDTVFLVDQDRSLIDWNDALIDITGYEPGDIKALEPADLVADPYETQFMAGLQRGFEERNPQRIEARLLTKSGDSIPYDFTLDPFYDDEDRFIGLLVSGRDISRYKDRELSIKAEIEEMYRRISDAFYALDREFRFTYVNERAEELLQKPEQELLGEKFWDVFPGAAEIDEVWEKSHRALETQTRQEYELYFDPLDFWVSASLYPSGSGVSVYFRDITERKEREQYLEQAKARFEAAVEAGAIGTWEWHVEDERIITGEQFARLFDVESETSDIRVTEFFDAIHEEDRERVRESILEAMDTCGTYEEEYRLRTPDGTFRWVYARGVVQENEEGEPEVFRGALTDITERKQYQQQLEEANERLEEFVYAASHDLREPARVMSNYVEFLEDDLEGDINEAAREDLKFIRQSADRMQALIDSLLKLSRVGRHELEPEKFSLTEAVHDARQQLQESINSSGARIKAGDLPDIKGDRALITDLYQNLISNAIKYSGDSVPRVECTVRREDGDLVLGVRDEGIGIGPELQDEIFEPFVYGQRTESRGLGLGLSIARRIVERHGGEIWIDSEPGEWTHVEFTLE